MSQQSYQLKRERFIASLCREMEKSGEYVNSWHYRFDQYRDIADKMMRRGILRKSSQRGLDIYTKGPNYHLAAEFT